MKKYTLVVAGAVALMVAASSAQAGQGWYIAGGAGATFLQESSSDLRDTAGNAINFDTDFDPGFNLNGALGYAWDSHGTTGGGAVIRVEGEGF